MITTAEITGNISVVKNEQGQEDARCNIIVPLFGTNGSKNRILNAHIAAFPGQYQAYKSGDKVWVNFREDLITDPIIIGLIYDESMHSNDAYSQLLDGIYTNNLKANKISLDSETTLQIHQDATIKLGNRNIPILEFLAAGARTTSDTAYSGTNAIGTQPTVVWSVDSSENKGAANFVSFMEHFYDDRCNEGVHTNDEALHVLVGEKLLNSSFGSLDPYYQGAYFRKALGLGPSAAWCAAYVSTMLKLYAQATGHADRTFSNAAVINWKNRGKDTNNLYKYSSGMIFKNTNTGAEHRIGIGDLCVIKPDNGTRSHVSFVRSVIEESNQIIAIEGNTWANGARNVCGKTNKQTISSIPYIIPYEALFNL